MTGLCGSSCEGIEGVDTIGVYEFDTKKSTVVATHLLAEGIGGDPYPSPDGSKYSIYYIRAVGAICLCTIAKPVPVRFVSFFAEYIVLLGKNGGKTVRVLAAGSEGSPSKILADLELDFNRTGFETLSVAKDFAFVERDGKTLFVMPSGTEHKVAIVDFTDGGKFETTYVAFSSDKEFDRGGAPHGRYRQVEWAVGTDYVWTNDSSNDEVYVIDVIQGRLVKTIPAIESTRLVSVQNFERVRMRDELLEEMRAMQDEGRLGMTKVGQNGSDGSESLGIAAIMIGSLALLVGAVNLFVTSKVKRKQMDEKPPVPGQVISNMNDVEPSLASVN